MSGTTVTASTSVVLVPTSSNYTRPYIVTFPNISTFGRLITVRDNDGFASTGNTIVLSTTAATTFNGVGGALTINQPYGFITLTSQANGTYSVLNTFAFPAGQAAANVSNLNAQVVNIQSTLNMYDFGTGSTNTIYTSSSQFIFNGEYIGQVTDDQLASTVQNLGTTYLSSIPFVYVVPPTWVAVGQTSTISEATSTGSLAYSSNGANWSNVNAGKGFAKYGAAVAYGEGYYIAVGNNDSGSSNFGYNQWSFNARDWYYSYAPALTATQMRTACLYANGLYHSVGCNNGIGGPNTILWSDDGKTWYPSLGNPFAATNGTGYATGIAFGSGAGSAGVWVCSGVQNASAARFALLWSTDGSNWNPAASVPFGSLDGVTDVAFDGTRFVALCRGTTNICASTDGSNWTSAGISGANFNNQPRYIAGCNGTWVATTGNPGQSLVYSLDGGFTWQSNANLSGSNLPMYKPYYDGLKWWVGVETADGSQSIFYTTETAPSIQNWTNGGQTGGFINGGIARGFVSTDGQSNVNAILNSTIFGLSVNFGTSNFTASTISVGTAYVGELNASTLYIGVTFVSTTYETINNISTQNVDFISAGTLVSSSNFLDSLSVNRVSAGQAYVSQANMSSLNVQVLSTGSSYTSAAVMSSLNVGILSTGSSYISATNMSSLNVNFISSGQTVGGPARFQSLSTNTISSGTASIRRLGVNTDAPLTRVDANGNQYSLDVNGGAFISSGLTLAGDTSYGSLQIRGGATNTIFIQDGSTTTPNNYSGYQVGITSAGTQPSTLMLMRVDNGTQQTSKGVFLTQTGSVGINTTTPSQTLDVNGSVWARSTLYVGSNTSTSQIRFYGTTGDNPGDFNHTVIGEYLYGDTQRSDLILFKGNDSSAVPTEGPDRVRVLAAGGFQVDAGGPLVWNQGGAPPTATYQNALFVSGQNGHVGIGTPTPTHTLQTVGDIYVTTGNNTTDNGGAINFGVAEFSTRSPMSLIKGILTNAATDECQGGIAFQTRPFGSAGQVLTERMRISDNGNVTINQNLTVSGNMSNNGNLSNTGRIYIYTDGTAVSPAIVFGSDTDTGIYHPTDGHIAISANGGQRLLITGSYTSNTGGFSNSGNITANGIFYGNGSGLSNIAFSFSVAAI